MTEPQQPTEGAPKREPLNPDWRRFLLDQVEVQGERIEGFEDPEHTHKNGWVDYRVIFEGDDREAAMHGVLEIKHEDENGNTTVGRWALGFLAGDTGPEARS